MFEQPDSWLDLVEKALFERNPHLRPERFREARAAVQRRLDQLQEQEELCRLVELDISAEREMLQGAEVKLNSPKRIRRLNSAIGHPGNKPNVVAITDGKHAEQPSIPADISADI
ncbi:MAG TPA: hypothetical protein VH437_09800 [Terriglobales bacterium]|jgi:hypothetical protein